MLYLQDSGKEKGDKNEDYVEALKKGGLDQDIAKRILDKWKEVGADDPNELRKLFLKQSLLPISATALQVNNSSCQSSTWSSIMGMSTCFHINHITCQTSYPCTCRVCQHACISTNCVAAMTASME